MNFRKLFKRIGILLFILVVLGVVTAFFYSSHLKNRALPNYNLSVELALTDSVEVYRDRFAVPHVYAKNELDLYKSVGYITAQDRLWQMDLLRRVTQGRVSEVVGEKAIKFDLLMRSLQLDKKSAEIIDNSSDSLLQILQAYADGVNLYIANNKGNLPQEFAIFGYEPEEWEINHSVNLIGYIAWDLTPNYKAEIILEQIKRKLGDDLADEFLPEANTKDVVFPEFNDQDTLALSWYNVLEDYSNIIDELGLTVFSASNNWAISSQKSQSGHAMLANDMHLKFGLPGIWYQIHEVVENELNVTGVLLPGQPFVISGHNDSIAWGLTNLRVDNIDFYEEKISSIDTTKYELNKDLIPLTFKEEVIKYKGKEKVFNVRYTHRGPVISDWTDLGKEKAISMKWVGSHLYSSEVKGIWQLNHANNWGDFTDALKEFGAVSQNVNYADTRGNIGIKTSGGVPIRKKGKGSFVAPGWVDTYDWKGYVPFDSLPVSYNPKTNFVASANNKTVDDSYPYYINRWFCTPYRMERISDFLMEKKKVSIADFKALQNDYQSTFAEKFTPKIITALSNQNLSEFELETLDLLKTWDYNMVSDSPEALVFENFCMEFLKVVIQDELGEDLYVKFSSNGAITPIMVHKLSNNYTLALFDDVNTTEKESFDDCVLYAYQNALESIKKAYSENIAEWQWGKQHQLTIQHPLGKVKALDVMFNYNSNTYPVGGSFHTVSPYFYSYNENGAVKNGASHRQVYTAGDWDNSFSILPTGSSGLSASLHYLDQLDLYIKGDYHPDYFSKEKVVTNTVYKTVFK